MTDYLKKLKVKVSYQTESGIKGEETLDSANSSVLAVVTQALTEMAGICAAYDVDPVLITINAVSALEAYKREINNPTTKD